MPNEPASTVCDPPLDDSGFFAAQEKDDANTNSVSNNACTTVFFTIPPTECLPFVTIAPLRAQLPQPACPWSRCERLRVHSRPYVLHKACGISSHLAGSAAHARSALPGNGAATLPSGRPGI